MKNLKFLASTVREIWRGSQNVKSRSRDPFPTYLDLILQFVCMPNLNFLAPGKGGDNHIVIKVCIRVWVPDAINS